MKTVSSFFAAVTVTFAVCALGGCAAEVEPQPTEPTPGDENKPAVGIEQSVETQYGSTYNSNCVCLACTKYCQVDGKTYKDGTCC